MRFLLDTNVLIKLEPPAADQLEAEADAAARLNQLITGGEHAALVHPAIEHDIDRDPDPERRELNRFLLIQRFTTLPSAPDSTEIEATLGSPAEGSNDWVDLQLAAAAKANAVDYVVTEDIGLIRRMRRLGLGDRVLTISQAVQTLEDLFEREIEPPPVVEGRPMYSLDIDDPIWTSFGDDYDDFRCWFGRASRDGRPAWVIAGETGYGAVGIVKTETDRPYGLSGKVLKICSFKVAPDARGSRYGELLLKTIFRYAHENAHELIYVEVFPRHSGLIILMEDFGFELVEGALADRGESVLAKPLRADAGISAGLSEFEFHRRYGPPALHPSSRLFTVPIQPSYHRMLFPDAEESLIPLVDPHPRLPGLEIDPVEPKPYGNAIKKAYLSHAQIRQLRPGDSLLFYRSDDLRAVAVVGVVEDTLVSSDPGKIATFVGPRTVYTFTQIEEKTDGGEVLAVLFRHDRSLEPVSLTAMMEKEALRSHPQSITQIHEEGLAWMREQIGG